MLSKRSFYFIIDNDRPDGTVHALNVAATVDCFADFVIRKSIGGKFSRALYNYSYFPFVAYTITEFISSAILFLFLREK